MKSNRFGGGETGGRQGGETEKGEKGSILKEELWSGE